MALSANYPCPWPNDKLDKLSLKPTFSAKFVI
jgi:hypothetical protein